MAVGDEFNQLVGADVETYSVDDLVGEAPPSTPLPDTGVKAQAANIALLADTNEEGMQDFQTIVDENRFGLNDRIQKRMSELKLNYGNILKDSLMTVLVDPEIDLEKKQEVVNSLREGSVDNVSSTEILAAQALGQPSAGRSEYDEAVSLTTADMVKDLERTSSEIQGLVNAVRASRDPDKAKQIQELLEVVLTPMEQGLSLSGVQTARYQEGETSALSVLKALTLPGSSIQDLRDKLISLQGDEKVAFASSLINAIKDNSDLIFTNDNQTTVIENLEKVFADEYTTGEKYADNIFNLLDIIGIGGVLKSANRARKELLSANTAEKVVETERSSEVTSTASTKTAGQSVSDAPVSPPMVNKAAQEYDAVRKEYEETLAVAANELQEGSVTALRAEQAQLEAAIAEKYSVRNATEANAARIRKESLKGQLARVNEQLNMNTQAAQARERLTDIENRMNSLQKKVEMVPASFNPVMESIRKAQMQGVTMDIMTRTPGHIIYNTNPERSRNLHHLVYASTTDEASQALFGVSRNEALLQGIVPQVATEAGHVKVFPTDLERTTRNALIEDTEDIIAGPGGIQFTPQELVRAQHRIVRDFTEDTGLNLHSGMSNVSFDGEVYNVSAVYTKGEGGWLLPEHAVEQAAFALRSRGITQDQITVLKRQGQDYVPVKYSEVKGVQGDYAVRVNDERAIEATDITDWDKLDVKRNLFDRFQFSGGDKWGSLNRHVITPDATLSPYISGAAIVSEDKSAILAETLLKQATKFSDAYTKLPKARQSAVFEYIKEANQKGLALDSRQLYADGFSNAEIQMLKDWRTVWDAHYYLENLDVVRSLRRDGFEYFSNDNVDLVVKPISKNFTKAQKAYDPAQDKVITLSRQEMDDLYNAGGTLADLRRPEVLNGDEVETMIVRNNVHEYTRQFRDDDKILNKREGYYQVSYKAPRFIDETYRDSNGVERTRTIAVAGNVQDANDAVKLFQNQNPNNTYRHRRDERQIRRDSDSYWDMNSVGGRIAQRHRGKTLNGAVGIQEFGKGDFIETPADSAIKAIMSVSGRTAFRPMLDAARERFMRQYADVLPRDPVTKQVRFPQSRSEIARRGDTTSKELADARTTYEYLHYLENGYINSIDNTIKSAFHMVADMAGNKALRGVEKVAEAGSNVHYSGAIKGAVFGSMIASNPLRQWIVQSNQIIRTFAYNPVGWVTGSQSKYTLDFMQSAMGLKISKDSEDFVKFVSNTGMFQAITKNNLIRDTLLDMSDKQNRIGRVVTTPVNAMRAVGFDIGEKTNLVGHAAAVWDAYKRAGKNVNDRRVQAEMQAKIRDLTWNMNFAGDMPYNQNALSYVMTYMQVPHKALLQYFNRNLSGPERLRLVIGDLALWGTPTALISTFLGNDWLTDDPAGREIVTEGLQSFFLNWLFSNATNSDVNVDWSSLAPTEMDGWSDFFRAALFDGGVKAVIDRAPVAQVMGFSGESRIGGAIKMASRMFTDSWNEEAVDPVTFWQVADAFGRISSGWNNYQKSRAMLALGTARDKMGKLTDTDVSKFEAYAQMFGFGTADTKAFYETMIKTSAEIKNWEEQGRKDAEDILKEIATRYNNELPADEILVKTMNLMMFDPTGNMNRDKYLAGLTNRLFENPEDATMSSLIKLLGVKSPSEYRDLIRQAPLPEENKQRLIDAFDTTTRINTQIQGE